MENQNKKNIENEDLEDKLQEALAIIDDGLKGGNLEDLQEATAELSDHIEDHPELEGALKSAYALGIRKSFKELFNDPDRLREALLEAKEVIAKLTRERIQAVIEGNKKDGKDTPVAVITNQDSTPFNSSFAGLAGMDVPDKPDSSGTEEVLALKQISEANAAEGKTAKSIESNSVNLDNIQHEVEGQVEHYFTLKTEEERNEFMKAIDEMSEADSYSELEGFSKKDRELLREGILNEIKTQKSQLDKNETPISDFRTVIEMLEEALQKDSQEEVQQVLSKLERYVQNEADKLVSKSVSGFDTIVEYYSDMDSTKDKLRAVINEIQSVLDEGQKFGGNEPQKILTAVSPKTTSDFGAEGGTASKEPDEKTDSPEEKSGPKDYQEQLNKLKVLEKESSDYKSILLSLQFFASKKPLDSRRMAIKNKYYKDWERSDFAKLLEALGEQLKTPKVNTQQKQDVSNSDNSLDGKEASSDDEQKGIEKSESIPFQKLLLELSQSNPELNKQLKVIFDILALDAGGNELLKSIQDDLENELLGKEIPARLQKAVGENKDFNQAFYKLPYRKQRKALKEIKALLDDEEIKEMVEDAEVFLKSKTDNIENNENEASKEDENPFEDEDSDNNTSTETPASAGWNPFEEEESESEDDGGEGDKKDNDTGAPPDEAHGGSTPEGEGSSNTDAGSEEEWVLGDIDADHEVDDKVLRELHPRMAKFDPKSAEVKAIKATLEEAGLSKERMKELKDYLANPENFSSEGVIALANKGKIELKKRAQEIDAETNQAKGLIESKKMLIKSAGKAAQPEKISELESLYQKKLDLDNERTSVETALKYKEGKMTYKRPEELLMMINIFLSGDNGDAEEVIKKTEEAIQKVNQSGRGKLHNLTNRITFGLFKPRLTSLLRTIGDDIEDLKGIETEDLVALAKLHNDQKGVDRWVENLNQDSGKAYETVVPKIIGYLEAAINAGSISYVNSWSLRKTKNLADKLKISMREHHLELAEKTKGGTGDKVLAYLTSKNKTTKATEKIAQKTLKIKLAKIGAGNVLGLGGAIGTAGAGVFALGAGALAAGGALASGGLFWKGRGAKNEKTKSIYKHAGTGSLVASALGAGIIGFTGLGALPALAIAAGGGVIAKPLWSNRKKIAENTMGAAKGVASATPGVAKIGWRATKATTGLVFASTFIGLPVAYFGRNFFFKK